MAFHTHWRVSQIDRGLCSGCLSNDFIHIFTSFMSLKYTQIDSQELKESNDIRFIALRCIVFELSACENSAEFPAESGCKANDLTRYKVDTACRIRPYI